MEFIRAKFIWIVLAIGALLVAIFSSGLYSSLFPLSSTSDLKNSVESTKPRIISTSPTDLNESTVLPTQSLEFTFSEALENEPETRWEIQPSADLKAELSSDKKTFKLTPNKPFELGSGYTLKIKPETKLEGKKTLEQEYIYNFRTIEFKGS